MSSTEIVFPAVLDVDQFVSQHVAIGAPFPPISITLVNPLGGVHEFKIAKQLPHQHSTILDSAVAEAKLQIEHFWTVLAFVRDTVIRPTGDVFYEFNGQRHQINRRAQAADSRLVGVADSGWFAANQAQLCANYDIDRIKRLNFAVSIPEPIGRFIALYSLLLTVGNDRQAEVDQLILAVEPSTYQTPSPKKAGQFETLYTRLRNELAHARQTTTVFSTHEEIQIHLVRFEWIVKSIVRKTVQ